MCFLHAANQTGIFAMFCAGWYAGRQNLFFRMGYVFLHFEPRCSRPCILSRAGKILFQCISVCVSGQAVLHGRSIHEYPGLWQIRIELGMKRRRSGSFDRSHHCISREKTLWGVIAAAYPAAKRSRRRVRSPPAPVFRGRRAGALRSQGARRVLQSLRATNRIVGREGVHPHRTSAAN